MYFSLYYYKLYYVGFEGAFYFKAVFRWKPMYQCSVQWANINQYIARDYNRQNTFSPYLFSQNVGSFCKILIFVKCCCVLTIRAIVLKYTLTIIKKTFLYTAQFFHKLQHKVLNIKTDNSFLRHSRQRSVTIVQPA